MLLTPLYHLAGIHEVGDKPVVAEDDCLQSLQELAAGQVLHRHLVLHQAAEEVAGPRGLALADAQLVNVVVAQLGGLLEEARLLRDLPLKVPEVVVTGRRQLDLLMMFVCEKFNIVSTF